MRSTKMEQFEKPRFVKIHRDSNELICLKPTLLHGVVIRQPIRSHDILRAESVPRLVTRDTSFISNLLLGIRWISGVESTRHMKPNRFGNAAQLVSKVTQSQYHRNFFLANIFFCACTSYHGTQDFTKAPVEFDMASAFHARRRSSIFLNRIEQRTKIVGIRACRESSGSRLPVRNPILDDVFRSIHQPRLLHHRVIHLL